MKTDRLFQIVFSLLRKNNMTAAELAEKLSVSVRTIYRDVEALSMAGIPVYSIAGKGGGISLLPGFTIDKATLNDDEWRLVLYALQGIKVADEKVDNLITKIGSICGKKEANWIEVDLARWGHTVADNSKFDLLKEALLKKQIIDIRYTDSYGMVSKRRIKPIRLVFRNMNWYLYAYCMAADGIRCFKVNRINEIDITDDIFDEEYDDMLDIDTEVVYNEIELQLRLSPAVAYRAIEDFGESSVVREKDGKVLLSANLPYDRWIISYILSYETEVEIIRPAWLKDEVKRTIKKMKDYYET